MGGGHNLEVLLDEEDDEEGSNVVVALRLDIGRIQDLKLLGGVDAFLVFKQIWTSGIWTFGHRICP